VEALGHELLTPRLDQLTNDLDKDPLSLLEYLLEKENLKV
jgi:hypothetical protein